jgi:hypothetical protein
MQRQPTFLCSLATGLGRNETEHDEHALARQSGRTQHYEAVDIVHSCHGPCVCTFVLALKIQCQGSLAFFPSIQKSGPAKLQRYDLLPSCRQVLNAGRHAQTIYDSAYE